MALFHDLFDLGQLRTITTWATPAIRAFVIPSVVIVTFITAPAAAPWASASSHVVPFQVHFFLTGVFQPKIKQ
ncbi:MAG: hypothetical protein ACJASV_002187 [Pseudorhodobacter sp.]